MLHYEDVTCNILTLPPESIQLIVYVSAFHVVHDAVPHLTAPHHGTHCGHEEEKDTLIEVLTRATMEKHDLH